MYSLVNVHLRFSDRSDSGVHRNTLLADLYVSLASDLGLAPLLGRVVDLECCEGVDRRRRVVKPDRVAGGGGG